jgi:hypothetical protein
MSHPPSEESKSTHELLATLYANFNARAIDAVLAKLDPAVDWANGMEGGREHGCDAVRAYWQRQWAMIDPNVVPVRFTIDEAGRTVVDVHQVIRDMAGEILADQMVQHVYVIRGGLVQSMEIRKSDAASGD